MPIAGLALALAVPALVWYAAQAILESTDGDIEVAVNDPTAPGYEALVLATPSHLVFGLDPDGELSLVAVMSLASNDTGGTVLLLPAEALVVDGSRRLVDVYRDDGRDDTRREVARLIEAEVDDVTELDADGWAQLTGPVSPVEVLVVDPLVATLEDGTSEVRFSDGQLAIEAARMSEFVGWVNPDQGGPFNRLNRQRLFFEAWVEAIAASDDPGVVPGEVASGLGRFLRGVAAGFSKIEVAPVEVQTLDDGAPAFTVVRDELHEIVNDMLPFPLPAESGARPRVRLLDGVGGVDVASNYSPQLVDMGAQIVVIGNASVFGVGTTTVVYHDDDFETQAQAFADVLGGAALTFEPLDEPVLDVTVIIGEDQGQGFG